MRTTLVEAMDILSNVVIMTGRRALSILGDVLRLTQKHSTKGPLVSFHNTEMAAHESLALLQAAP